MSGRCRAYAMAHETNQAKATYEDFFALWKGADRPAGRKGPFHVERLAGEKPKLDNSAVVFSGRFSISWQRKNLP
jgi:hypothetical protein